MGISDNEILRRLKDPITGCVHIGFRNDHMSLYERIGASLDSIVWIDPSSNVDAFFESNNMNPSKYNFWYLEGDRSCLKSASASIKYAKAVYMKISNKNTFNQLDDIDVFLSELHFKRVNTYMILDEYSYALYIKEDIFPNTETYNTPYGLITLYKNEGVIGGEFKKGIYWDIDTLFKLRQYIDPNRNILEIGGHCGTSSIVYASFLNNSKIYVYEPQYNMYKLLVKNINQNNLQDKIIPNHLGVFCFEGDGMMNDIDLDGGGGNVEKRYNEENDLDCNFGGIGLGQHGEKIKLTTIDHMNLDNIGFIHCDAQGSENFILSKGIETITKNRPVILFENNYLFGKYLYDNVCNSYKKYKEESLFDVTKYCMENLGYSVFINQFNGSIDTLLIP